MPTIPSPTPPLQPSLDSGPACRLPRGRASWSGLLRVGLVAVPVKAYAAVTSASAPHFHLLHADCGQRIRYEKYCPEHGAISADVIVKGYEYAHGHHVVIEPEEL